MGLIYKILHVLILLVFIYLWNRFVIPYMLTRIVDFHKNNNQQNLHRHPIKFLITNEKNIVKATTTFFWAGALFQAYFILFDS